LDHGAIVADVDLPRGAARACDGKHGSSAAPARRSDDLDPLGARRYTRMPRQLEEGIGAASACYVNGLRRPGAQPRRRRQRRRGEAVELQGPAVPRVRLFQEQAVSDSRSEDQVRIDGIASEISGRGELGTGMTVV